MVDEKKLLTGDTILVGSLGRIKSGRDLRNLYKSISENILKLAGNVELYPGHEHGEKTSSTLDEEKRTNPALQAKTYEEFVEIVRQSSA